MGYLIISLLPFADRSQQCHLKEKGGDIAALEVSIVPLQKGSAEKEFIATHINA